MRGWVPDPPQQKGCWLPHIGYEETLPIILGMALLLVSGMITSQSLPTYLLDIEGFSPSAFFLREESTILVVGVGASGNGILLGDTTFLLGKLDLFKSFLEEIK
ncbi:hypothetical protein Lal_00041475 [Lupinus albus]|nr:hypothetical protein Lal_00041475 [Lupinus albus]